MNIEYRTRNNEYRISKENTENGSAYTSVQVALRFALHPDVVASAVTGIRTLEQLRQAVEVGHIRALSGEAIESLKQILPVNKYESHR